MTAEQGRLDASREQKLPWKKWGPYLSERQWGTVREDYSDNGDAWQYFSHDQARSRAYRWGEDGLAGISDDQQVLCFALALWNGRDSILKERMFGLTNSEGNHGEDVKEYYFYLDSTPTHSYMRYPYKYPQRAYPYDDIVATNQKGSRLEMEYELLDTGVFDGNRYFDLFVEYAKYSPQELASFLTGALFGNALAQAAEEGTANFYSDKFQGKKTSSGEAYDKNGMTAAHKSLPYGTKVKVTNVANGKSAVVTINDRMKKSNKAVIDVTRKAADELGFVKGGKA